MAPATAVPGGATPLVRPRWFSSRGGVAWQFWAASLLVLLLILGLGVAGWLALRHGLEEQAGRHKSGAVTLLGQILNRNHKEEQVFQLALPRQQWPGNDKLKQDLQAVVALEHREPTGWLALAVEDFGSQQPRDAELVRGALRRLESCFGEQLQADDQVQEVAWESFPRRLRFRGLRNSVQWEGYSYFLTQHGLAYWLFIAGTDFATAEQLQELVQGKLTLVDERPGWKELPPPTKRYPGRKIPCVLEAREAIWSAATRLEDIDPLAEIVLVGRNLENQKNNRKNALFQVLRLPDAAPDPQAALRLALKYLEENKKKDNPAYQVVPLVAGPGKAAAGDKKKAPGAEKGKSPLAADQALSLGKLPGRLLEAQVVRDNEPIYYVLLAAAPLPGGGVCVLQGESHWEYHQAWREDFLELLRHFRLESP